MRRASWTSQLRIAAGSVTEMNNVNGPAHSLSELQGQRHLPEPVSTKPGFNQQNHCWQKSELNRMAPTAPNLFDGVFGFRYWNEDIWSVDWQSKASQLQGGRNRWPLKEKKDVFWSQRTPRTSMIILHVYVIKDFSARKAWGKCKNYGQATSSQNCRDGNVCRHLAVGTMIGTIDSLVQQTSNCHPQKFAGAADVVEREVMEVVNDVVASFWSSSNSKAPVFLKESPGAVVMLVVQDVMVEEVLLVLVAVRVETCFPQVSVAG